MTNIGDIAKGMMSITDWKAQVHNTPAKYTLSQSTIKKLTDKWHCPVRFYAYEIAKLCKTDPSEDMIAGNLFEYLVLGSLTREGEIPVMPRKYISAKNPEGKVGAKEERVRHQASLFKSIMEEHGIELVETNIPISYRYNEELLVTGIIDARIRLNGQPAILDVKMTSDINSTFGYYGFGDWFTFDKIQAYMYQYIEKCMWGFDLPFVYAIFDHKPKSEHKIETVQPNFMDTMSLNNRIQEALTILKNYMAGNNIVHKPSYDTCRGCKVICNLKVTQRPEKK